MPPSRRRPEGSGKGAANAEKPLTKEEASVAMDRFKNLTRNLLDVPRAKVDDEQRRFDAENAARRRKNNRRAGG